MIGVRLVLLALAVALLPLLAPAAWLQHGAFPDLAALVVVFVALHRGPERGASTGVLIGLAGAPFTPEPLGLAAFVLGALGFAVGNLRGALYRDSLLLQMSIPFWAALLVRVAVEASAGGPAALVRATPGALLSAAATGIAAPPLFALLGALLWEPQRPRRRALQRGFTARV